MPFSPADILETARPWVVAWGVPVAYLVLSVAMNRVSKRLRPPIPGEVPATASVPELHPVLLGALRCHEESELSSERNAYEIALAAVARMLGHGAATFGRGALCHEKTPQGPTQPQGEADSLLRRSPAPRREDSWPEPLRP